MSLWIAQEKWVAYTLQSVQFDSDINTHFTGRSIKTSIADVAISKLPLLFTVWTQLHLRSHQNFNEIFTRKQFLPTSAGNAQAQLHFRDDQQRAFGISNISN